MSAALWILLCVPTPLFAVIPGLAPGLLALLPSLAMALVAALTVVASPRAWWRLAKRLARRPRRTIVYFAALLVVVGSLQVLSESLGRLEPPPSPLPSDVAGFPIGDASARGFGLGGPPPLRRPEIVAHRRRGDLALAAIDSITAFRDRLGVVSHQDGLFVVLDAATLLESARRRLDAPLACEVLPFVNVARGDGWILVTAAGNVILLHLDGSERRQISASARPSAVALVDERLVLGGSNGVEIFALERARRIRRLELGQRVVALAGDENRRVFALTREHLHEIPLDAPERARVVTELGGDGLALVVDQGLVHIVTDEGARGGVGFRTLTVDPSHPDPVRWSRTHTTRPRLFVVSEPEVPDALLLVSDDAQLVDRSSGATRETVLADASAPHTLSARPGGLMTLNERNELTLTPLGTGRRGWTWTIPGEPRVALPIFAQGEERIALALDDSLVVLACSTTLERAQMTFDACLDPFHAREELPLDARIAYRAGSGAGSSPVAILADPAGDGAWWLEAGQVGDQVDITRVEGASRHLVWSSPGRFLALQRTATEIVLATEFDDGVRLVGAGLEATPDLRPRDRSDSPAASRFASLWTKELEEPLYASAPSESDASHGLVTDHDLVLVATTGALLALSPANGDELWRLAVGTVTAMPLLSGERVLFGSRDAQGGTLRAVDRESGEPLFTSRLSSTRWETLGCTGELLFALGPSDSGLRLLTLDRTPGAEARTESVPGTRLLSPARPLDGDVVVHTDEGLMRIQLAPFSTSRIEGQPPGPFLTTLGALVLADGARLSCIDSRSLDPVWSIDCESPIRRVELLGDRVYAFTRDALLGIGDR